LLISFKNKLVKVLPIENFCLYLHIIKNNIIMATIKNAEELREKIREIILKEVETDSKYHGLDEYSVDTAVNNVMVAIEKYV
jgi:hypothetical protein